MTTTPASLSLALALSAALAGCIVTTPYEPQPIPVDSPPATYDTSEQAPEAPPPLPVYEQPPVPEDGYIWTPGVWRWGPEGYFWVPGTWVAPPEPGFLWTPGYWAPSGAVFIFHPGYWGRHVGYYGGINYGAGYTGVGFVGGRWDSGNHFHYNTAVTNVNVTNVHNTYNETVVNNVNVRNPSVPRPSYVGATGVHPVQPTHGESGFAREPRMVPTAPQYQHHDTARTSPQQFAVRNEGRPPVAATPRPGAFTANGVTAAKPIGPTYHPQHPAPAHEGKPR
jgi:hypothetical protein